MVFKFYLFIFYYPLFISHAFGANTKKPNIIFILADDYGWGDVGLHGSEQVRTPNIDVLASNGIILNNYYVQPVCSPSRGALLTGRHPIHTGLQHGVFMASKPEGLPLQHKILPQYLKELGYETQAVGKWHQGHFQKPYLPTHRGFDSHFGYWTGKEDYFDRSNLEGSEWGVDFRHNESPVPLEEYEGLYSTHIYTNKTIDIIMNRNNSSKPLFLYLAHQSVHVGNQREPLQVPQEYIDHFHDIKDIRRRTFVAMVSALDHSIGEIFNALQKADIINETIIIFSTDNGAAVGNNHGGGIENSMGSNWPLRGAKHTLFEGGIRGFSFIWSSLLKKQYVSNHLMHIQDWLPTIYGVAGGRYQDLGQIDGIDMWDVLNKDLDNPRKHLLHNIDDIGNMWALRDGDYKLIYGTAIGGEYNHWFLPPGESNHTDVKHFENNEIYYKNSKVYQILKQMNFHYKTVEPILVNCNVSVKTVCKVKENPCLFKLRADPCECNNLYKEKPEIVKSMLNLLSVYNSTAVKPLVTEVDPNSNPVLHKYLWNVYQLNYTKLNLPYTVEKIFE